MSKNIQDYVYLDNNSTTELSNEAAGVLMDLTINNVYGNPSSIHLHGLKTRALLEGSREAVAKSLGASPCEIVFTGGGTEANNLAIRGVCSGNFSGTNDVVVSAAEHPSVLNTVADITDNNYRIIPLYSMGTLDLEWASNLITEDTKLVSIMLANNITGAIFQVADIADMARRKGVPVHCDAVQAYGKIPIDVKELGVDLLSISGHKAHAMAGTGALYVREGFKMSSLITGGDQESGFRAGTENYLGIATLGVAAEEITKENLGRVAGLRDVFESAVKHRVPGTVIQASKVNRVPNTSAITFKGIDSISMVLALEEAGILASAGPACSSGLPEPSKTLISMGLSTSEATSTVRFSFSKMSTMVEVSLAIEACVKCAELLRSGRNY